MENSIPKNSFKILIDTAKEISAGGETIRQTFGELSISLERLLTKTTKTTSGTDGSQIIEKKEWLIKKEEHDELVNMYLNKSSSLLDKVYKNQKDTKQLIFNITRLILGSILLVFFVLPLVNNNKIIFNFSNLRSFIIPKFLSISANQIVAKDIALVIFGGITAYILVLLTDKLKEPTLTFEVGSAVTGSMENETKKHKFIHIRIKNYDKKFSFMKFIQPSTLVAFSTKATIIIKDNHQRKFTCRWSNHPQFLPKVHTTPKGTITIPDINSLVQGREDIHPQPREANTEINEDKEIDIGLKYEGEHEFYVFNNESYFYTNNDYKDNKFKFSRGIYDGKIVISTMGIQKSQKFRIYNTSNKLEDFKLELIS